MAKQDDATWKRVLAAVAADFLEDFGWLVWMIMLVFGIGVFGLALKFMTWALG